MIEYCCFSYVYIFVLAVNLPRLTYSKDCLRSYLFGRNCKLKCHCKLSLDYCDEGECTHPQAGGCAALYTGPICQIKNIASEKLFLPGSLPTGLETSVAPTSCYSIESDGEMELSLTNARKRTSMLVVIAFEKCLNMKCVGLTVSTSPVNKKTNYTCNVTIDFVNPIRLKSGIRYNMKVECASLVKHQLITFSKNAPGAVKFCKIEVYDCTQGTFGDKCQFECNCENDDQACDTKTGHCISGCAAGWKGTACNQKCEGKTYGKACSKTCNCENENEQCNHVTGECDSKCPNHYTGIDCHTKCMDGHYILSSELTCNGICRCKVPGDCDYLTGHCGDMGCEENWMGSSCDRCDDKHFGKNCREKCNCVDGKQCHKETGYCPDGCPIWYSGKACSIPMNVVLIFGVGFGVPILVVLLTICSCYIHWRRKTDGTGNMVDCGRWYWYSLCECFSDRHRQTTSNRKIRRMKPKPLTRPRSKADIKVKATNAGRTITIINDPLSQLQPGDVIEVQKGSDFVEGLDAPFAKKKSASKSRDSSKRGPGSKRSKSRGRRREEDESTYSEFSEITDTDSDD